MLRIWHIVLCFIGVIALLQSCNPQVKNKSDLYSYINDPKNELIDTINRMQVIAKITWQPWQLISNKLGEIKDKRVPNSSRFSENLYFILSLSKGNKELLRQLPFEKYSQMVQVLSFRMFDFISAKPDEKEPIFPIECLFQQTYGMTNANMLLVVFKKKDLEDCRRLAISIKEFGLGIGELKFQLNASEIEQMEEIDYLNTL